MWTIRHDITNRLPGKQGTYVFSHGCNTTSGHSAFHTEASSTLAAALRCDFLASYMLSSKEAWSWVLGSCYSQFYFISLNPEPLNPWASVLGWSHDLVLVLLFARGGTSLDSPRFLREGLWCKFCLCVDCNGHTVAAEAWECNFLMNCRLPAEHRMVRVIKPLCLPSCRCVHGMKRKSCYSATLEHSERSGMNVGRNWIKCKRKI